MKELTLDEAHRIAREKGINPFVYRLARLIFVPLLTIVCRLKVIGAEHVPATGPVVITPNHKSFWDSFFVALAIRKRRVHFMGKADYFSGLRGRAFLAVGAFPVRRGESDSDATETASAILRRGDVLALFPEGTRVKAPDVLGVPKRGAARFAIENGAPIVPAAISGSEKRRFHLPRRVQVSFAEAIPVTDLQATPETAAELINNAVWPEVEQEYRRLVSKKSLLAAGIAAVGVGLAVQQRRKK